MTILDIETAIINRLKEQITDLKVEGFPDNPKKFRLNHPKGHILARYNGSKFSGSKSTDLIIQDRDMKYEIAVTVRSLRDESGAYEYLEACRLALTGYTIERCRKMYPVSDDFKYWNPNDGIWNFAMVFNVPTVAVEDVEEDNDPLLTSITAEFEEMPGQDIDFLHGVEVINND